jgi:hypothetical protein
MPTMKTEKQTEHEFDFFKKNPVVQGFKKTKDKIIPKSANKSGVTMRKGTWAVLIAALGLLGLHNHVEYAGWVLFLAFLKLDERDALIPFALAGLGLLGLYHHVEFSGWLIFAAFMI